MYLCIVENAYGRSTLAINLIIRSQEVKATLGEVSVEEERKYVCEDIRSTLFAPTQARVI